MTRGLLWPVGLLASRRDARRWAAVMAFAVCLLISPYAGAQGCTMCTDAAAGSTPQMRKALRIAIPLLGVPAAGIFVAALVLARKMSPVPDEDGR